MEERLNYELDTISTMGFVDYFLIVLLARFKKQKGAEASQAAGK